MAKKKESTSIAPVENLFDRYPIANPQQSAEVLEIIRENLGTAGVQIGNLDKITVPPMGDTEFRVDLGEGTERIETITGMILLAPEQNALWSKPIEEAPNAFPVCYSADAITGTGDPFDTGQIGQHDCLTCPKKAWQTDFKGRGKACRDLRPLFMLREGEYLPIVVQVPRMSLKKLSAFFTMLSRIGAPYYAAIVEVGLAQEKKENTPVYSVLTFKLIGKAPREIWPMLKEYQSVLTRFATRPPTAEDVETGIPEYSVGPEPEAPTDAEVTNADYDPFEGAEQE